MPPCFRRILGTIGPSLTVAEPRISRLEGLECEMRSRPFLSPRTGRRFPAFCSYGHFPAKHVRSLAWGPGAVTMTVWITNAQATGATVTARAEQTRTNHPTAGAQPLQTCAPKTAMRAIATAETGRPLVKASRRRAAFRATSTPKPTSTKARQAVLCRHRGACCRGHSRRRGVRVRAGAFRQPACGPGQRGEVPG